MAGAGKGWLCCKDESVHVIPCYNEKDTIRKLAEAMLNAPLKT